MPMASPPRLPVVLRNRNLFLIWSGQVLSQTGTRMYQIALAWWIVTSGGGGKEVGLFMVAGALPALLFVRLIGRTVDRHSSRRVLVACDLAAGAVAAAVALLFASSRLDLVGACWAGFGLALAQAFFDPALNKAVAQAAAPEDLEAAVAFQSSTQSLASFAGAMAGALLIDRIGIFGVIALNAASFLASAASNALLRLAPAAGSGAREGTSSWEALDAAPGLKPVLFGFGCVNFFLTPILVVLPLYVKSTLRGGASLLGGLEAGIWLGILCGTFGARWLPGGGSLRGVLRLGAGCMLVLGAALLVPGVVVHGTVFFLALFCAGGALGGNNVKFVTFFQAQVRAEHKGRFFALLQALLSFTFPAAFFLFGLLAEWLSPPQVCLIQALGVLALAGYFLRLALTTEVEPCRT
ncbi:MAG: MFS transporter [Elusimicrobia bacterium]|nr:MFS transporter [Elusimicrobiota bacterium]